ncbi:uncharacterized protein LOC133817950 [Humulus lupulus]|uniref:uncharacterized protein LOC133817950 n=1 Tax=Humulus lupulus TaxID=3486 RepID=UPI002B4053E4|nr:uncharacterized protein LOC133817950 [Humulus lupulus]
MVYVGPRDDHQRKHKNGGSPKRTSHTFYTDLTHSREHIFIANKNQVPFKRPPPMKRDLSKRYRRKYCQYHKDIWHTTAECTHLKMGIEELIRRGHLGRYVRKENQRLEEGIPLPRAQDEALEVQGEVRTIFEGPGFGGESRTSRDKYAREARRSPPPCVLSLEQRPPKNFKGENDSVTFNEEDMRGVHFPHSDPLVFTV